MEPAAGASQTGRASFQLAGLVPVSGGRQVSLEVSQPSGTGDAADSDSREKTRQAESHRLESLL